MGFQLSFLEMGAQIVRGDRAQRVTIWSTIFMVVVQQIRHPLGHTAVWQGFAAWVAMHMPSFS
jgi:hypothetical protein